MTYHGFRFGEIRDSKGNHHYVEFDVGQNLNRCKWRLVRKPMLVIASEETWGVAKGSGYVQAGFKWVDFAPVIGISPEDFEIAPY